MTIKDVAAAFNEGRSASGHNCYTNGLEYFLHDNCIAYKKVGCVVFDWCGWYGPATANHMNSILQALGLPDKVSYAQHRDSHIESFKVNT